MVFNWLTCGENKWRAESEKVNSKIATEKYNKTQ